MNIPLRLAARRPSTKVLGVIAVPVAIVMFSMGSTLVKLARTPGELVVFWRMLVTAGLWNLFLLATGRRMLWKHVRRAILPGIFFGLNLAGFFTGVTHNTVANAEMIGAMTPFIVVPIGARLFSERLNPRALLFALVGVTGVTVVLFSAPAKGDATVKGNVLCAVAVLFWAAYIVATRRLRGAMDVAQYMAAVMTVGTLAVLPLAVAHGDLTSVSLNGWKYLVLLSFMTGVGAHGLMVVAQRTVPIGTIGIAQIAQPALAAVWSFVFLDESLHGWQFLGLFLVLGGLLGFVILNQRVRSPQQEQPTHGELAGPAG